MTQEEGISVDPDLFAPVFPDRPWMGDDSSVLVETDEVERATEALQRAGKRYPYIAENGHEFADDEELAVNSESAEPLYAPNWVSPVYRSPYGPHLVIDWKDSGYPEMERKMIAILIEEL
jgi:hypothetical protein